MQLNDMEVTEQNHCRISNSSTVLENLNDSREHEQGLGKY